MLLSIDWDAYSGTVEHVFDAPIWGTPDREHDRAQAWRARAAKRGGPGAGAAGEGSVGEDWAALEPDFPLYPGWEALRQYAGVSAYSALSHADARAWLERYPGRDVLNIDSHHDLYSGGGDTQRWRPGNWAGLGLASGLIRRYEVRYPAWHAGLRVAEGYDLERTREELAARLPPPRLERVRLTRAADPHDHDPRNRDLHDRRLYDRRPYDWGLPPPAEVEALLLVQSPAWTSPAHDAALWGLVGALGARPLTPLQRR